MCAGDCAWAYRLSAWRRQQLPLAVHAPAAQALQPERLRAAAASCLHSLHPHCNPHLLQDAKKDMLKVSSASLCLLLHSRSRFWNARSSLHRCPSVGRRQGGKARVRRMPAQLLPPLCRLEAQPWRQCSSRPDCSLFRVGKRQHGSSTRPASGCTHHHRPVLTLTTPHECAGGGRRVAGERRLARHQRAGKQQGFVSREGRTC